MKRLLTVTALTAGLVATGTGIGAAAPAQRLHLDEQFDGTEHWGADDNLCGGVPATFHEVRSGGYDLLLAPGGQQPGEVHVNGAVDGVVDIVPDDPALPALHGTYREKVDGILVGSDPATGEDVLRVATYRLRVPLTATDGRRRVLTLSGKVTLRPDGSTVVARSVATCA